MSYLSIQIFRSLLSGFDARFQDLVSTWLLLMIIVVLVTFIVSEMTRNYSQVDKLWSLLPVVYGGITAAANTLNISHTRKRCPGSCLPSNTSDGS